MRSNGNGHRAGRSALALILAVLMVIMYMPSSAYADAAGYTPQAAEVTQLDTQSEAAPPAEPDDSVAGASDEADRIADEVMPTEMPAQSFSKTAANGVNVKVTAGENVFPKDTVMKVTAISEQAALNAAEKAGGENVKDAVGVDITFYDKDGKEIEPADGKNVKVRMSLDSALEGETFSVIHEADNGRVSEVAEATSTGASFSANGFSIYIITGEGASQQPAVATYKFYDAAGNIISTQMVKDGEKIYSPKTPEKDGFVFKGWANAQNSSDIALQPFKEMNASVSETGTFDLYPVYQEKHYVFFLDDQGRISTTKEGVAGDTIGTSDVIIPLNSTHSVTGWYSDIQLTARVETVTLEDKNVYLYPKVEEGHYLTFASGEKASYVAPQFVTANGNTSAPAAPVRPGYTFKGWSSTENGTTADFAFGAHLTEDTTVYAVWEADPNTSYTVIHWWQNANDDNYSFHEAETKTGAAGTQTSADAKTYAGFTAKTVEQKNIEGDGSTIVNIYYDRNIYTVHFYQYYGGWREMAGLAITAKYGADIADKWPSGTSKIWGTQEGDNGQGKAPYQSGISTMPLNGANFYKVDQSGRYTMNLNYWIEPLSGGEYELDHTDSFQSRTHNWITSVEDHYDIKGFTYTGNIPEESEFSPVGNYTYEVNFQYSRNTYNINFYNGGASDKQSAYKYEADISSAEYTPERPTGVSDEAAFVGWFDNELGVGDPYVFSGKTMPAANITLYAKWQEPTYACQAHLSIAVNSGGKTVDIPYGTKINANDMPQVKDAEGNILQAGDDSYTVTVPANYTWAGWSVRTEDGSYVKWNFDTEVYNKVDLYPYYISTARYSVTYDSNGGSGSVADEHAYAEGSYADIKAGTSITAPAEKVFLCWNTKQDGSGTAYYPGDKANISGNITLYAQYGDISKTTKLTYHSNYPDGANSEYVQEVNGTTDLSNNTALTISTVENAGFSAPENYYFTGWNTAADGSGDKFDPGEKAGIDNTTQNDLYAQWVKKQNLEITITGHNDEKVYNGSEQSVSGYDVSYTLDGASIDNLPEGLSLNDVEKSAKGTNAGSYDQGLAKSDFSVTGDNVGHYNITINVTDGKLTIKPAQVTITTGSATKEYDGSPLTKAEASITGLVNGETATVTATGSQTEVGSSTNTYSIEWGTSNKENYVITETLGTLEVTTNATSEVKLKAADATKVYDGTALEKTDGVTWEGLPEGFTVEATSAGSQTDAGESANVVNDGYVIKDGNGVDQTANFTNVTKVDGTLKVTKAPVTITTGSATKEYDGSALTNAEASITGLKNGETATVTATGSQTEVGSSTNTYSIEWGTTNKDNYEITETLGTLEVTKNASTEVKLIAADATKEYDGTALAKTDGVTWQGLPAGFTVEATSAGSQKDAGSSANVVNDGYVIKDGNGVD